MKYYNKVKKVEEGWMSQRINTRVILKLSSMSVMGEGFITGEEFLMEVDRLSKLSYGRADVRCWAMVSSPTKGLLRPIILLGRPNVASILS